MENLINVAYFWHYTVINMKAKDAKAIWPSVERAIDDLAWIINVNLTDEV